MGGELWMIQGHWQQCAYSFTSYHIDAWTVAFMVKTKIVDAYRKQETKGIDTHLQFLDIFPLFVFIDLFNSLSRNEMPTQL
jgi:hypothetical protein